MTAIDWTEKCRDEFPDDAGELDWPFDGSETFEEMQDDWRERHATKEGSRE